MAMKKLVYAFLMLCLMTGCTHTSRHPQLVAVDSLLASQPDSALALLRQQLPSFGGTEGGGSVADRMYYYLLLADACNKCYDTLPSDSIMHEVTDFYDRHGTANEQVRAHYLLGCVYRDLGEAPQALDCYHTAIDRADTTSKDCNYRLLSRVHAQVAELFMMQNLPSEAIQSLNKSITFAYLAQDTLGALKMEEYKMINTEEAHLYDNALEQGNAIHRKYLALGEPELASASLYIPILIHVTVKHDYEEAKRLIEEYEQCSGLFDSKGAIEQDRKIYYYTKGLYYLGMSFPDSAEMNFRYLLLNADNENEREAAYKGLCSLYKKAGKKDSVAKYAELCYISQDSVFSTLSTENMQRLQTMFDYSSQQKIAQKKTVEVNRQRTFIAILLIIIVFTVVIAFIITRYVQYRKNAKIQSINARYSLTLLQFQKAAAELTILKEQEETNRAVIKHKEAEIAELQETISQFHDDQWRPDQWRHEDDILNSDIVSRFHLLATKIKKPTSAEWNTLYSAMRQAFPKFMSMVEGKNVSLSFNEIAVCVLIKLRFVPSELVVLLKLNYQAISNIRARLLPKLFHMQGGTKEFDKQILSHKESVTNL